MPATAFLSSSPLPVLHLLGTGGTIAGTAGDLHEDVRYQAATLDIEALLAAVPALRALPARLQARQLLQKDSKDLDPADWLAIARATAAALHDPHSAGVVITHGTDTLEETAWLLHRVLPVVAKPVVLVSAMRPATALAADGPQNLLDACQVALTGGLHGVVAVAAGEILGAAQVQKLRPYRIPAFGAGDAGPLGWIEAGRVRWAAAERAGTAAATPLPQLPPLLRPGVYQALLACPHPVPPPKVAWITSHAGFEASQIEALTAAGFDGLLVASTGNGTLHHALENALRAAHEAGVAVALTSRCAFGTLVGTPGDGCWRTLALPAAKARVELLLELWSAATTLSCAAPVSLAPGLIQ